MSANDWSGRYGWRARLGLLVPSTNTVNETEWARSLPEGVSLHTARMRIAAPTVEELERMSTEYERAGELVGSADADVVAFGCTTGSLFRGKGFDEEIEARLGEVAGCPAVATSASIRRAFDTLGMSSLAVATPYTDELNEPEVAFFEECGYEVADIHGMGVPKATNVGAQTPQTVYRQVRDRVDTSGVDGIFISCTDYRTFEIIELLEADFDLPIVTSNQATLWDALRTVGVDYTGIGLGRLFQR